METCTSTYPPAPGSNCSHQALMDAIQEPVDVQSALPQKDESQERVDKLEEELAAARSELEKDSSALVTSVDGRHSQPQKIARLQKQQRAGWNYHLGTCAVQLITSYLDPDPPKPMLQNLTSKRLMAPHLPIRQTGTHSCWRRPR